MAAALTPLGVSALALLAERPMHPYEMYQLLMERSEDRVVKVRPGSLYHTVARLAEHELVAACGTDRAGGRPERTTYRITPEGRAVLAECVRAMLASPVNEYPQFPLALGEAHNLPRGEVVELLTARTRELSSTIEELAGVLAASTAPEVYRLDTHYLHAIYTAELHWLRHLLARLENGDLPWPTYNTG
jgi:DNA-binding PadR family transcriptional regulator